MKKHAIALLLACCSIATTQAQDCKLDVDKTDPFTKEHVRSNATRVGPKNYHWTLSLEQIADKYYWEMELRWGIHLEDPLGPGNKMYISTEGGDVVELIPDKDYYPAHRAFDDGFIISAYNMKGSLNKEALMKLKKSPSNLMRATLAGKNIEPKISSKQGAELQKTADCLLQ